MVGRGCEQGGKGVSGCQVDVGRQPYPTTPCHALSYPTTSYHTLIPYPTLPYHTTPYHTLPYPTTPDHSLPLLTIPYHTLPYPTQPIAMHYPTHGSRPVLQAPAQKETVV